MEPYVAGGRIPSSMYGSLGRWLNCVCSPLIREPTPNSRSGRSRSHVTVDAVPYARSSERPASRTGPLNLTGLGLKLGHIYRDNLSRKPEFSDTPGRLHTASRKKLYGGANSVR